VKLLTVDEVAEVLRCARSTVYALVAAGKIAGFRIGPSHGGIRIDEADLQAYLDTCRTEPAAAPRTGLRPKLKHLRA